MRLSLVWVFMSHNIWVHEKGTFSLQDALLNLKGNRRFHEVGAIATFTGVVRGKTLRGDKVEKLFLEAYEEAANDVIGEICDDLEKLRGIIDIQIHHLVGDFEVGDDLVFVLVAGSHRKEVFKALEKAVERYKNEVPIFKKEFIKTRRKTSAYWVTEEGARSSK